MNTLNIPYTTIQELKDVLTVLKSLNIPQCKIIDGSIRGKSEDMSTCVITPTNMFDFNIGINNCVLLLSRLNSFDDGASYVATLDDDNNIQTLTVKKGRVKSIYTACQPTRIKAPKSVTFEDLASFTLTAEDVKLIRSTAATVHEARIHINSDGNDIIWYNGDAKNETVAIETLNPSTKTPFGYQYEMKSLLTVLRLIDDDITVTISEKGFLKIDVVGLTTISLPYTNLGR